MGERPLGWYCRSGPGVNTRRLIVEEGGFVQASLDSLKAMGHTVHVWRYKTGVNAIARSGSGWVGVADPRRGGGAVGY